MSDEDFYSACKHVVILHPKSTNLAFFDQHTFLRWVNLDWWCCWWLYVKVKHILLIRGVLTFKTSDFYVQCPLLFQNRNKSNISQWWVCDDRFISFRLCQIGIECRLKFHSAPLEKLRDFWLQRKKKFVVAPSWHSTPDLQCVVVHCFCTSGSLNMLVAVVLCLELWPSGKILVWFIV